jgi:hypothetical protein
MVQLKVTRMMKLYLMCSAFLFCQAASAYTPDHMITESGIAIKPILILGIYEDDNIFNVPNEETSSTVAIINPSVNFELDDGVNSYWLKLGLESGSYEASADDDYLDGNFEIGTHLEANDRNRIDLSFKGDWITEPRGTGITEGENNINEEPVTYQKDSIAATYGYGAMATKGRVDFDIKYDQKNYTNFEAFTRIHEYDAYLLGTTFFYSTNSYTNVFFEVNAEKIRYSYTKPGDIKRDSDVYTAMFGAELDASSLTSGFVKLGVQSKEFTDNRREDFSGFNWDVGIKWRPLSYSYILISTSRSTKDPDINGDYIIGSQYRIDWNHNWNSRISTSLKLSKENEEYSGVEREDNIKKIKLTFNYELTRWVTISFFGEHEESESTLASIVYDKRVVGANLIFSL